MRSAILLFLCCLLVTFVSAQPTVSGLSATVFPNNVLRYDCNFVTSQAARGYLEYYYFDGSDTIWATTGFTDSATVHPIVLLGLVPQMAYHYRGVAFDATGNYPGVWEVLNTGFIPTAGIINPIIDITGVAGNPPGYVLTNTASPDPDRYVQIHNRKGNPIWYERMPGIAQASVDGPCQSFTYNPTTHTIFFTDCGKVTEMAFDGSVLHTVNFGSLAPGWMPHHDVYRNAAGNWLVLAANVDTVDKSTVGGDPNALVVGPGIFEFSPTGTLVWSWSAFDHLDPLTSPAPGGDWVPKFGAQAINWLDANSVMQDGDGNPMLSFGGESQAIKVSRVASNVVWTCGDNGDIEVLPPDSFHVLHSLRPSRPGYYLSFDNQWPVNGQSRVIEWWIDFSYIQARMEVSWEYILPLDDYSSTDGNVFHQSNGNYMIGSHDGRSATEVTATGSVIWHARYDSSLHRAYWVDDLYDRVHPEYLGDTVVCASDGTILLEATPPGGIWSGPFVSGDSFDAAAAGAGFFPLTYQWGPEQIHFELMVDPSSSCGVGAGEGVERGFSLDVFPNPFRGELNLRFELARAEVVTVDVFALDGRMLGQEVLGKLAPGEHVWGLAGVPTAEGGYLLRLRTASGLVGTRIVVMD